MENPHYIHGTHPEEQSRLEALNSLMNSSFLEFLRVRRTDRVLEVGSGLGILAAEVSKRCASVVGLEYSSQQLEVARKRENVNLKFVQGDAHKLPFREEEFDVVYCRFVLEHVVNPEQVLSEIRRVLKPGGRFFILENDIHVVRYDPPVPMVEKVWPRLADVQAIRGGDALIGRKIFGLLKGSGFRNVEISLQPEVHTFDQSTFVVWNSNLIGIIEGARQDYVKGGFCTSAEVDAAIQELRALEQSPNASIYFYWNRATAEK